MVGCPLKDCILSSQLSQRACNLCIIFDVFMTCVGHAQKLLTSAVLLGAGAFVRLLIRSGSGLVLCQ